MPLFNPQQQPFQNLIQNGDMVIAQRGTSFAAVANTDYNLDRWSVRYASTAVTTVSQSADVPSFALCGQLFQSSLQVEVTTADAAVAAADVYTLRQTVEGYNFAPQAGRPLVARFAVRSSVIGVYSFACRNSIADRSYVGEFTIDAADTWEYKIVPIVASPSAGTWNYTNGIGLNVTVCLMAGANFQTAPNLWTAGNFLASPSQANALATIGNIFRMTGFWVGPSDGPQQFISRDFATELALCQRYYEKTFDLTTAPIQNAGLNTGEHQWPASVAGVFANNAARIYYTTPKRAAPTMVLYNPAAANAEARDITAAADCSATAISAIQQNGFYLAATGAVGTVAGNRLRVHWTASAEQ